MITIRVPYDEYILILKAHAAYWSPAKWYCPETMEEYYAMIEFQA